MSTYLKVANVKSGPEDMPVDPPIHYKFPLDPFQQHAMKAICSEENVLVTAKTGSGKTLTSFKSAQLATKMPGIDKVLFVVDRKDLDYQTMQEYDRFEKGAANSNTSTKVLKSQLENPNARIIITTIQKLSTFIGANRGHEIYDGHVVIIFDECHRSQFVKL